MTPDQIDRIRQAAKELEAALNDARCQMDITHRQIEVANMGDAIPKYAHEIHITATSELRVFP